MYKKTLVLALGFFISFASLSQKKEVNKWDVNNPHEDWKYKNFNLKTDEGKIGRASCRERV